MLRSYPRNRRRPLMKVAIALTVALMVTLGGASVAMAGDEVKIGYVDLLRALEESEEGQRIKSQMESEIQQRQQQLDAKQQQVMQSQQQFEQQASMLSPDRRRQMEMELQQEMAELQQTYLTLQQELMHQEVEATSRLFEQMRSVIEEIGQERGFTIIIEKTETSVLFSQDGMDLTDELIERFDAKQ